jgi:hypothetical protein
MVYQNLDLHCIPKSYIYIVYQNIDLYRTPKPKFIQYNKT